MNTTAQEPSQEAKRSPEFSLKARTGSGRIELAVWRTEGEESNGRKQADTFSIRVKKSYYKENRFHESNTLFPEDLLVVAALCQQAYAYCLTHQASQKLEADDEEEAPC